MMAINKDDGLILTKEVRAKRNFINTVKSADFAIVDLTVENAV